MKDDWFVNPKTKEEVSFIDFARSEGRFSKHFDKDGNPSATLLMAKQDRLENWHLLAGTGGTALTAAARSASKGGGPCQRCGLPPERRGCLCADAGLPGGC